MWPNRSLVTFTDLLKKSVMENFIFCAGYNVKFSSASLDWSTFTQWFSVSCNSPHVGQKKSKEKLEKKSTETAFEIMSLVLEIILNSKENTCTGVSF